MAVEVARFVALLCRSNAVLARSTHQRLPFPVSGSKPASQNKSCGGGCSRRRWCNPLLPGCIGSTRMFSLFLTRDSITYKPWKLN